MSIIADLFSNFGGELAALVAAFLWASATMLFSRIGQHIRPLHMNLLKNIIAMAMMFLTLLPSGNFFEGIDPYVLVMFMFSGAVGIGVGDSAYFAALNHIGPRRSLILWTLSPPLTAIIAIVFLGEYLTTWAWIGVLLAVGGIAWVITERTPGSDETESRKLRGTLFGLIAALGQATGAVLAHAAFLHMNVSPLRSAFLRLIGGTIIVLLFLNLDRKFAGNATRQKPPAILWLLVPFTVFIGTYLGIWLQQISLKYTAAGIAQTLLATSPLFVLPMAIWMGERVSTRAFIGAAIAIAGVALLFAFQS